MASGIHEGGLPAVTIADVHKDILLFAPPSRLPEFVALRLLAHQNVTLWPRERPRIFEANPLQGSSSLSVPSSWFHRDANGFITLPFSSLLSVFSCGTFQRSRL